MSEMLRQETYLLGEDNGPQLAKVYDFLTSHEDVRSKTAVAHFLSGSSPDDRVELPDDLYRALRQMVEALRSGHAVSVSPITKTLTTQQAAELLGISRPTLIRLLDNNEIPFERVGNHRRIPLQHLLAYRERRRAAQYAFLAATSVDEDDYEDPEEVLARLRAARREVAKRRRERTGK